MVPKTLINIHEKNKCAKPDLTQGLTRLTLLAAFWIEAFNLLYSFNPDSHLATCFLKQVKSHDQAHTFYLGLFPS